MKINIRYQILNSIYNKEEYETQSLDTKIEVCGGTREALAIRRTLSVRQCSRACGIVLSLGAINLSTPYPQTRRPHS